MCRLSTYRLEGATGQAVATLERDFAAALLLVRPGRVDEVRALRFVRAWAGADEDQLPMLRGV